MKKTRRTVNAAAIAAIYTVLTLISFSLGLSGGAIQLRLSEALTVLPCFMPEAVWGLFAGCLISNIITGCALWDIIAGSLATLVAAVLTYTFRKNRWLAGIFPIAVNTAVIPVLLYFVYKNDAAYLLTLCTVFAGELISCGIFGQAVYQIFKKIK